MSEKQMQPLLPKHVFLQMLLRSILIGLFFIAAALLMGMYGYHHYEKMTWVDAFVNAAMILSGMGPVNTLVTDGGKIFAGMYALFSGLSFIVIMGVIYAPVIRRFLHKFHLDIDK